jgi:hypothetical protein
MDLRQRRIGRGPKAYHHGGRYWETRTNADKDMERADYEEEIFMDELRYERSSVNE